MKPRVQPCVKPCALLVLLAGIACSGSAPPARTEPAPVRVAEPAASALSGLAAQHIVVLPLYAIRVMPDLAWGAAIGNPAEFKRTVDAEIAAALEDRGIRRAWILPDQLEQSYKRNATYATDPYTLAEEPLRNLALLVDARLPDPLASQLRTMVALHDDARLILAPVEMRFEKAGSGGQAVLRLVLIDPRFSSVRWVGDIASDTAATFGPALAAQIAAKLANAIAPRA